MAELSQARPSQGFLKTEGRLSFTQMMMGFLLEEPRFSPTLYLAPSDPHLGLRRGNRMPGTFGTSEAYLC